MRIALVLLSCVVSGALAQAPALAQSLPPAAPGIALFRGLPAPHLPATPVALAPLLGAPGPGQQCRGAIRAAERAAGIPHQLMAAIARVESGRREPDGAINPWPWSINAEGEDHVFDTKAEAIAAVRALQAKGTRSIDVGCMQVNLLHHPDAFPTLDQAFDPVANANYAARFLLQLRDETGTWPTATAWYHSATPDLGADYERKVMAVWPEEQKQPGDAPLLTFASSYANGYASGFAGRFANGYASSYVTPNGPARIGEVLTPLERPTAAHVVAPSGGVVGRSLAAYRAAPIQTASRPVAAAPVLAAPPPPRVNDNRG